MHSGRVLVVAPNDDLRRSLTFALMAYGYTVTSKAAWPDLENLLSFDCVVLDENALPSKEASEAGQIDGRKILLLAYSQQALANTTFDQVIAMPLKSEAVIQSVADVVKSACISSNGCV